MKNEQGLLKIRENFLRVVNKLNTIEKTPHSYGTDELLYASEMGAIETLGYQPGLNVTEFAQKHGITKGAVSQLVKKLEKKGLVTRHKSSSNRKEVLLKLTTKGEIAFHQHSLFHLQAAKEFFEKFENMPPEKIAAVTEFLEDLDALFDKAREIMSQQE
jgi:DNA-binding MarR family transcriptional regulator